ncbi:DUF4232 domain-containing protein [Streptomyces tsukubensis]|nr:DUF4232 domain-containing protein [Streptomyces tsukubensis]QFR92208.1 DUF4232 domain-containing protein [Streptomyces tsukubensis]
MAYVTREPARSSRRQDRPRAGALRGAGLAAVLCLLGGASAACNPGVSGGGDTTTGASSSSASATSSASASSPAPSTDGSVGTVTRTPTGSGTKPPKPPASKPPSSTAAPVPSGGGSPNTTAQPSDRCTSAGMRLSLGRGDPGAGNIHYPLVFTNASGHSCALRGFPGVSLLAGDGRSIGVPAKREGPLGPSVRLAPGAHAHAVLHTLNEGMTDTPCWTTARLVQVFPPGARDTMTARTEGLRVCGGTFTVTTVTPGADVG